MAPQKVSIMIPTFNQAQYIVRAIKSAQAQSYADIEILISDDCSTDETRKVVEDYMVSSGDPRIMYFRNEDNIGILRNYRKNLYENATGHWAINLDGDDFFVDPEFISGAVAAAAEDPSIVLLFGNYCEYHQKNGRRVDIVNRDHPQVMSDQAFFSAYASNQILWNHNSIIYRRNDAIRVGFYWDDLIPRNDWESFLRLIVGRKVGYLNLISAAWVQHDSNETRRLDLGKYLNNYTLIKGVADFALKRGMGAEFITNWTGTMIERSTKSSCIGYIRNKDFRGMFGFLRQAYKVSPALPLKMATDPGLLARSMLALNPSLYNAAKVAFRKIARR
ncbi:MAG: glycosyltransferase family 2 protein [Hydrogenophaga sp.]|nr:glycosyltransferase family 2 protein [Hydrogenophaga sp.]